MNVFIPESETIVHERMRIDILNKAAINVLFQIIEITQPKMNILYHA